MPITAASDALVRHLRARLGEAGGLNGCDIQATTLRDVRTAGTDPGIALVLWRVQPDEPSGEDDSPGAHRFQGDPPDGGGLVLRYLLLARGLTGGRSRRCSAAAWRCCTGTRSWKGRGSRAASLRRPWWSRSKRRRTTVLKAVEACGDPPPLVVPTPSATSPAPSDCRPRAGSAGTGTP
jgi:hypothetical protein